MDLSAQDKVVVGLIADTHGFLEPALLPVLNQTDVIIHAGDILNPAVLTEATPRSGHVLAVRGNNDTPEQWPAGTAHFLDNLPLQCSLQLPGGLLTAEHGHKVTPARTRHEKLRQRHQTSRAIVYGHTHRRIIDQTQVPWILNPGAAGRIRAIGGAGCLLLTATTGEWSVDEFVCPRAKRRTVNRG